MKFGSILRSPGSSEAQNNNKKKEIKEKKEKKQKICRICRFRRLLFPWREPRICVPPTPYRPDNMIGASIDRREWEVVQANFAGPVGQWYAPDDPDKPDAFTISTSAAGESLAVHTVPMYEDRQDEDSLPPYEWARLSNLPSPVVIGDSWPSLLAAQREKSRLLETQDHISFRIAEIDRKVKAVMDTKLERDPKLHSRHCSAQMAGALFSVGLLDIRGDIRRAVDAGKLQTDEQYERLLSQYGWLFELDKVFVLRERLSPLSLLSPPPSY